VTRAAAALALLGLAASSCAGTGARGGEALSPAERAELLSVRESVWRAWFAGDEERLEALLPPDFVAIDAYGTITPGRETQLDGARSFHSSGGRLARLEFPETEVQLLGDVAVIYTTYVVELETPNGPERMAGRATEVFARRDGRWVHPGWHLDRHE
jgi:ketosteroid isomerase-like protein